MTAGCENGLSGMPGAARSGSATDLQRFSKGQWSRAGALVTISQMVLIGCGLMVARVHCVSSLVLCVGQARCGR